MAVPLATAARLDRDQRRTARIADREADRFGASPRERLALFEALAVEAGFRNPDYGDADSVGALQERSHYGSVARRLNVKLATRRFLGEARALREQGFKGSAGALAQAVQRSAFGDRYDQHRGTALEVVNQYGGLRNQRGGGGGGGVAGGTPSSTGGSSGVSTFSPGDPQATAATLTAAPAPIASAPVAPPEFIAQPKMPTGYQPAPSIGGPVPPDTSVPADGTQGIVEDFSPELAAPRAGGGAQGGGGARIPAGEGLMPARQLMKNLIRAHKLPVTARKEPGHEAGGDHDPNTKGATAWDIGGDEGTREAAFHDLMRELGVKGAKYKGKDVNVTIDGLRYQVISRDHGTGPHLHVGVRKA